jgi:hypothetical protein
MLNAQNNQIPTGKIGKLASTLLKKYEILLVTIAVASVVFKMLKIQINDLVLTIPLLTLSIFYYFRSFALVGNFSVAPREKNTDKFYYYSLSVATIGILFRINGWAGSNVLLTFGGIGIIITLALMILFGAFRADSKILDKFAMPRIILLLALVVILRVAPSKMLVRLNVIKEIPRYELEKGK